jgi:hypothetical protein
MQDDQPGTHRPGEVGGGRANLHGRAGEIDGYQNRFHAAKSSG